MRQTPFAILSRNATRAALASGLVAIVCAVAPAQSPAAPRWNAWIGCWQAGSEVANLAAQPIVCITAAEGGAVELATVERERATVIARDTLDASGEQRPFSLQGCKGWRRGEWSRDGRRLFLRSDVSCGEGLNRTSTGVLSISNDGDWIDVQSATAGGNASVRTAHYRAVTDTAGLPAEFASVIRGNELRLQIARAAAGAPVSTVEVIEAVQQLDTLAVQSWLIELGQKFELDGKRIVELAKAGVPGSITDVMVGVSFPQRFQLVEPEPARGGGYAGGGGDMRGNARRPLTPRDSALIASQYYGRSCAATWDPMWMPSMYDSYYDPCAYRYGMPGYYGYRSYYGFAAYGGYYGPTYYGYYSPPVIIVRDDEPPRGKLVKGVGYTRGGQSSTTTSSGDSDSPRAATVRSSSGSEGSRPPTSGSSSTKSSGSSGGSTGRTAQTRGKGGQ